MSRSALDGLLNETDAVVKALVVAPGTEVALAEATDAIRAVLSRGAAQLAQAESDLIRRMTQTNLPAIKPDQAKLTSIESAPKAEEAPKVKGPLRYVAIAVFVAAAIFHAVNTFGLFDKSPPLEKALAEIPSGYVQARTKPGAPLVVLPALNAGKPTEEQKKAVLEQAKKEGKTVKEIAPGAYVVQ